MEASKKRPTLLGADFSTLEKRVAIQLRDQLYGTQLRGTIIHDEILTEFKTLDEFYIEVHKNKLSIEEWRWAVALRRVYNVNASYFEEQKPTKRAEIIEKLMKLAERNNRAGCKAAEAVAIVVEMAIERKEPEGLSTFYTEIANNQLDAYRYLFSSNTSDGPKKGKL